MKTFDSKTSPAKRRRVKDKNREEEEEKSREQNLTVLWCDSESERVPEMEVDEVVVKSSEKKKRRSIDKLQKDRSETIIPARGRKREKVLLLLRREAEYRLLN